MDRYQKVEKPTPETSISENEIRITTQGTTRNYISYATSLLQGKRCHEIALKAMGSAINKSVMIAELIKRRIEGLHQNTSIGSMTITEMWEPIEEGLLPLETIRHVSTIAIILSKVELDATSVGYQPPIPVDQVKVVKPWNEYGNKGEVSPNIRGSLKKRGARGRSRDFMREHQLEVKEVIELPSSPESLGSPVRGIFCLKKNVNMREIEEREDCFILDFDPKDSLDFSKLSMSSDLDNSDAPDIFVLAEKGQIACRDYPHSRHLCLKNPFEKMPHESYCELCYCFVCDKIAPCNDWSGEVTGHCHAISNEFWNSQRRLKRELKLSSL